MADENASRVERDPVTGVIRWIYTRDEPLNVWSRLVDRIIEIVAETGENRLLFDGRVRQPTLSTIGVYERTGLVAKELRTPHLVVLDAVSHLVDRIIEIQSNSDWKVARVVKGSHTSENRHLIDTRSPRATDSITNNKSGEELGVVKISGKKLRIALLFNRKISLKTIRFTETILRNRGLEATVQPDEESALRWLGIGSDDK